MTERLVKTLEMVAKIAAEEQPTEILKGLERITQEDPTPATPLICAVAMTVGRANYADFSDEEKDLLDKLVGEGESRAGKVEKQNTAESFFVRGMVRLIRPLSDQIRERPIDAQTLTSRVDEGRSLIEQALSMDPTNEVYELMYAMSLRFFPTRIKDKRKQEGISRLAALGRRRGIVGKVAKLMLWDNATRHLEYEDVLSLSQDLKKAYPRASWMRRHAAAAYEALGDLNSSVGELRAALRVMPGDPTIEHHLNNVLELRGKGRSRK